ncbi:MAG TPA: adenosylcobinamide-GDP ribazoletransferase [Candidatus Binatia bacterium]|nr:adenosylcobinamide-GDP ribazoletransferase [Candidatus Binatia bacterium]
MNLRFDLVAAVRFLTRVPLPASARGEGFGAAAFPLVGLLLGAAALGTDTIAAALAPSLRNVAIVAVWALLTGALHYDGLADTLDAFAAPDREERLRIMRDTAIGAFAVLGIVLNVAAELAALAALDRSARRAALLVAPALGRCAMVLGGVGARSARDEGLGAAFARDVSAGDAAFATLVTIASAAILAGRSGLLACLLAGALTVGMRRLAVSRFGGVTGDVLGATGLVVETLSLAVFASK